MKIKDQGGAVHIQIYRWVPQACALYMPALPINNLLSASAIVRRHEKSHACGTPGIGLGQNPVFTFPGQFGLTQDGTGAGRTLLQP